MTLQRFLTAVFLALSGLGGVGAVQLFADPDVDVASKAATALVTAVATALLWRTAVKQGAPVLVLSSGGVAFLAWWGGTLARVLVGVLIAAIVAAVLTRNRPVNATATFSHILRVPPEVAFDAVMVPRSGLQPGIEVRDRVQLPNGGSSYWLIRGDQHMQHHVDTEWDPPLRGATASTIYRAVDGVTTQVGTATTLTTFAAVARGTRATTHQQVQMVTGGLYSKFGYKAIARRTHTRYLRRAEVLARAGRLGTAERVRDPDAGPYLQSDD